MHLLSCVQWKIVGERAKWSEIVNLLICCAGGCPARSCRARWLCAQTSKWRCLGSHREEEQEWNSLFLPPSPVCPARAKSRSGSFIPVQSPRSRNDRKSWKGCAFWKQPRIFSRKQDKTCYILLWKREETSFFFRLKIGSISAHLAVGFELPILWIFSHSSVPFFQKSTSNLI